MAMHGTDHSSSGVQFAERPEDFQFWLAAVLVVTKYLGALLRAQRLGAADGHLPARRGVEGALGSARFPCSLEKHRLKIQRIKQEQMPPSYDPRQDHGRPGRGRGQR